MDTMVKIASKRAGILLKRATNPYINLRIDKANEPIEVSEEIAKHLTTEDSTKGYIYIVKKGGEK